MSAGADRRLDYFRRKLSRVEVDNEAVAFKAAKTCGDAVDCGSLVDTVVPQLTHELTDLRSTSNMSISW